MSEFTDEDIPIACGECSPEIHVEGLGKMIAHILKYHKQYTAQEAVTYANAWLETAYESVTVQNAEYAARMRGSR